MRKSGILVITILVLGLVAISLLSSCSPESSSKLRVVTSTSLIASIVERVGGDKVDVVNIIAPSQCPGHFDVKPSDIQKLAEAELFLLHGWQGEMFSQKLIDSANNPNLTVVVVDIKGNWMTPSVQVEAADRVASAMSQVDADNTDSYLASVSAYKESVKTKEAEIRDRLEKANLSSINVMCAEQQAGFVQWAGFNVIATYGRPETLTPQIVKELVDKGRKEKVTLIIDNVQSGMDAGAGIAEELGCARVILSNFPGCFDDTGTWEKAIDYNVELLMAQ